MFIVNVTIQVLPSAIDDFARATRLNHEGTRREPGNLRFDVAQSLEDPTRFLLYEVYRAPEDFTAHQATDHYKIWKAAVQPWMAVPRVGVKYRSLYPDDASWR